MDVLVSRKRLVFAGGVVWLLCASVASSPAQEVSPDGKVSVGLPVPSYRVSQTPAASLGLPQLTKPAIANEVIVPPASPPPPKASPEKTADIIVPKPPEVVTAQRVDPSPQPKKAMGSDEFQLKPPTKEELFRVESEATSRERIRKAALERKVKVIEFPEDLPLPTPEKIERPVEAMLVATYRPSLVCYHPLYFEQRLPERYGFFVPLAQPILSAGKFYADTLALPYRMALHRPWQWDCSLISLCR